MRADVTSDCEAVADVMLSHHFTNSSAGTIAAVLAAGMDSDCGNFFASALPPALNNGTVVTRAAVNAALGNLLTVQLRLGMFDPPQLNPYSAVTVDDIDTEHHRALVSQSRCALPRTRTQSPPLVWRRGLQSTDRTPVMPTSISPPPAPPLPNMTHVDPRLQALDAARQGIVLLKNERATLPLSTGKARRLVVVGPNANGTLVLQGNYQGVAPYLTSLLAGLGRFAEQVDYSAGCAVAGGGGGAADGSIAAAVSLARRPSTDAVVIVVGLNQSQESEGLDRADIGLPGQQDLLIERVAAASAGKPVVLVVVAGGSVDLSAAKHNPAIGAIVWAGYGGYVRACVHILSSGVDPARALPSTLHAMLQPTHRTQVPCSRRLVLRRADLVGLSFPIRCPGITSSGSRVGPRSPRLSTVRSTRVEGCRRPSIRGLLRRRSQCSTWGCARTCAPGTPAADTGTTQALRSSALERVSRTPTFRAGGGLTRRPRPK